LTAVSCPWPPTSRRGPAWLMSTAAVAAALGCHGPVQGASSATETKSSRIANLHAFARLYGAVRWFHPSDAAAAIDWDQFAIDGARRVIDVRDARELRIVLSELFGPFAPTVHIAGRGEALPREPSLRPGSTGGLELVAWQHLGYGDSTLALGY